MEAETDVTQDGGVLHNVGIAKHERFECVNFCRLFAHFGSERSAGTSAHPALLPGMRNARFGRIVNASSLVTRGLPFRTSYAAAKSVLESLTRRMAVELARNGITANAVAPGPTETELFRENNPEGSEGEKVYLAKVPMGRFASPIEIAAAIVFLNGDNAGFVTGQTLFVDGGSSLGMI
jgi:3-oxoacyl-[acyl-carrier protein] reductase